MINASILAAYLHGLTGENLGSKYSDYSVLATEIAENIGVSINNINK
jgi:NAD(P)H-hydrate repair Nnr-like enzyme with NAD(P)H-hydrate dehydratase domain